MNINEILAKLRNPWGIGEDEMREVRLAAADLIEKLYVPGNSPVFIPAGEGASCPRCGGTKPVYCHCPGMKVAKILTTSGHEFYTNDCSAESLAKLTGIRMIEIVEMSPEDFFRIPATRESNEFFAPLLEQNNG